MHLYCFCAENTLMTIIAKNHTLIIDKHSLKTFDAKNLMELFHAYECTEDDHLFKVSYTCSTSILLSLLTNFDFVYFQVEDPCKLNQTLPEWLLTDTLRIKTSTVLPLIFYHKQETLPVINLSEINMTLANVVLPNQVYSEKRMSNFKIKKDFVEKREVHLRNKEKSQTLPTSTTPKHITEFLISFVRELPRHE